MRRIWRAFLTEQRPPVFRSAICAGITAARSELLIAFSNHHYYQNCLVTFPSPVVDDRAVHLRKVPHGVYDRGKSRTNRIKADAVAKEAVSRMRGWLKLPEKDRPTLGVITFNVQQQSLILDLLDVARRDQLEQTGPETGLVAMFHKWHSPKNVAYETQANGSSYQLCHVRGTLYANSAWDCGRRIIASIISTNAFTSTQPTRTFR